MKLKSTLLAATLAAFAASAALADEDYPADEYVWKGEAQTLKKHAKKPVKKRRHAEEKNAMPVPEPAAGVDKQGAMKPMDSDAQAKEKRSKEGCEETLSC